jgi:phosphoglycerol transferase MdoB-like AlkP superfamily enzyme
MPYDYKKSPDDWKSTDNDSEKSYTESVHYSDKHLGKFFDVAKTKPWYNNTLFVIVADHSRKSIKLWQRETPDYCHIPLLLIGGALKEEWKGKRWEKIISQLDIPNTLLTQLHLPASHYNLSRNVLNTTTPSSAYYVFYDGCGYVCEDGFAAIYANDPRKHISDIADEGKLNQYAMKAACYQQLLYEKIAGRITRPLK